MIKKNVIFLVSLLLLNGAVAQVHSHKNTSILIKYNDATLQELSGMNYWNHSLWCINDGNNDAILYRVDPSNGAIIKAFLIENSENHDWEALTQDPRYFYIGDFGNNAGKRQDQAIHRIDKDSLFAPQKNIVTAVGSRMQISFPNPVPAVSKNFQTDYDAEAMVAIGDTLYIFTKRWGSGGTEIFKSKFMEGNVTLQRAGFLPVDALITDAVYDGTSHKLYLLAYHKPGKGCSVVLYILYGKPGQWDLSAGKRIRLDLPLKQAEAIALGERNKLYIGCEGYKKIIRSRPAIYTLEE